MSADFGSLIHSLRGGLTVSCQAPAGHPLRSSSIMMALALCAEAGGAVGIRANGPDDVAAISRNVAIPVVGIHKQPYGDRFLITPTFEHAEGLVTAGADAVALEATREMGLGDAELGRLIDRVRDELRVPVMADVSTLDEGLRARELGADLVATTLSGYTGESRGRPKPDLGLVEELAGAGVRVVCEGNVRGPEQAREALDRGAWAVVVGTAITDPLTLTTRFVHALGDGESGADALEGASSDRGRGS